MPETQGQTETPYRKQQEEKQQVVLLQLASPKLSNSHQGVQCSSKKRPLLIFQTTHCKNLLNTSQPELAGVGEKGQGSDAHATCQYPKSSIIPVIQPLLGLDMLEVSFMKASHTSLMIFVMRYDTSNLPLKPGSWYAPYDLAHVQVRQHFYGLWQRPQQAITSLLTERKGWVLPPPSWRVIVKTWQSSKCFLLKIQSVAGISDY